MDAEKQFRLTCPGREPAVFSGLRLRQQIAHLEAAEERTLLDLMPTGTTYVDSDGDTWERIA